LRSYRQTSAIEELSMQAGGNMYCAVAKKSLPEQKYNYKYCW